jgi:hypothetical protein
MSRRRLWILLSGREVTITSEDYDCRCYTTTQAQQIIDEVLRVMRAVAQQVGPAQAPKIPVTPGAAPQQRAP